MTRPDNEHAKAGNINRALGRLSAPFVAIFDADHVPTRSFLQLTMGWFERDVNLALLQTPQHYYSPDPFEKNLEQFRISRARTSCSTAWCRMATICGTRRRSAGRALCCGAGRWMRLAGSRPRR